MGTSALLTMQPNTLIGLPERNGEIQNFLISPDLCCLLSL